VFGSKSLLKWFGQLKTLPKLWVCTSLFKNKISRVIACAVLDIVGVNEPPSEVSYYFG